MASETVRRILDAEAEANKSIADARKRAEEIVEQAHQQGAIAVQKRLAEARDETEKIRQSDKKHLSEYRRTADEKCKRSLELLQNKANNNTEKAVAAIIDSFF